MSKRKFLMPLAVFGLLMGSLVACGGGGGKTSKPAGGSSSEQPSSSSQAEASSSQAGGQSTSQPQASSSNPISSSQPAGSSSQPSGSTSQPGGSTSQPVAQKSVSITECVLMTDTDGKAYVKVSGTQENYSSAEFKWAWGIKVNGDNGAFVDGKASPDEADYKAAAFDANKAFTVKYCLTDITALKSGDFYRVYGGTPESYADIAFTSTETAANDATRTYYLRTDQNNSFVFDSVQPIKFTKASVVNVAQADLPTGVTNEGAYVKFGGVNEKNITLDMLDAWHTAGYIAGNFQRVIGGYSVHNHIDAERFWKIEGNDIFFYCYVGFIAEEEGWMTHFDLVSGNSGANLQFDNTIWGEEAYTIGNAVYRVYADKTKSGESNYWGCLGVYREKYVDPAVHVHTYGENPDKVYYPMAGHIGAKVYNCTGTCETSVLRWNAKDFDTAESDTELEVGSDNIRFKSGKVENKNGAASVGSHIVYKVFVKDAVRNAGLAFRIKNTNGSSGTAPVFKTISGDSSLGAIDNGDGTYTTATHRYGLKVNGEEYFLGDDDYGNQSGKTDWFDWPTQFPLKAGVNTIDVFAYAGYRANMYEFQLTGLPKYQETFAGYNVTFTTEHCKVLVYETKAYTAETPVEATSCVARDEEGHVVAYDIEDIEPQPQVSFKVVCDEGYSCTVNNVTVTPTGNFKNLKQNPDSKEGQDDIFRVTKVQGDLTINIVAVQGEQAKGYKVEFKATNCEVKVFVGPKNEAGDNLDTPEEGIYYARVKDAPYDIGYTTPQVNFEVIPDAGYEFVPEIVEDKADFIVGDYNKFQEKYVGEDTTNTYYNITKVASDLEITIAATPTGGQQSEFLTEDVVLNYSGLTETGKEIAATEALAKIGQGNAHVTAAETTKIYDGTGSGGAHPSEAGMLKSGTGSAVGQIKLTLDAKANVVELLSHDFYKKDADHPTNSNTIAVNGGDAVLAPYNENGTLEVVTIALAEASKEITIDFNKRVYIQEIKLSYADPDAIAQPKGTFFASPELNAGGQLPILVQLGDNNAVAVRVNGQDVPNCSIKSFDKKTGDMVITITGLGDASVTYNPESGLLEKLSLLWDKTLLKYDAGVNMYGNEKLKYWNCDGTTEQLQAEWNRRYGNPWTIDTVNADRLTQNTEHVISGSAMRLRPYASDRFSLATKDFAEPFNARNISFWVYNSGEANATIQAFAYTQTGYSTTGMVQPFGNKTIPAGQWTYVSAGFNASNLYGFQIFVSATASALIFDDICLF
jgi:hypothetical protein